MTDILVEVVCNDRHEYGPSVERVLPGGLVGRFEFKLLPRRGEKLIFYSGGSEYEVEEVQHILRPIMSTPWAYLYIEYMEPEDRDEIRNKFAVNTRRAP